MKINDLWYILIFFILLIRTNLLDSFSEIYFEEYFQFYFNQRDQLMSLYYCLIL